MIDRRQLLAAGSALGLSVFAGPGLAAKPDFSARLAAIERAAGGRLGAFVLDTGSGKSFGWRQDERFCHCSTFKLSLAALVLREADAGRLDPAEVLPYSRADLLGNSPVTEANLAKGGLPLAALAEAAQEVSDNAAANLLLRRLGGPHALTAFWRTLGDPVSRLDDYEPDLNVIPPGTEKNSTTPRAMAGTLRRIVLGDVLTPASRARLTGWMEQTRTGMSRIRAELPADWRVLDKTGTGMRPGVGNKVNDIAVLLPPRRAPLVVAGYYENPVFSEDTRPADEAVLKSLGALAAEWAGA
ncbi:MAG: class A beta-lactamase [Porphyrobacter sp.]|nr:class A beta-lactamase [Porphyrobacter sp.]